MNSLNTTTLILPDIYPVACHTNNIGPGSTFVAIAGTKQDGARYIAQALERGATCIVLDKNTVLTTAEEKLLAEYAGKIKVLSVDNTRKALAELSAQAHNYPARSLKVIGVTGTKGKSTTVFLLEHILKTAGYKTALLSTVKNRILTTDFPAPLTTAQPDYLHMFFNVCKQQNVDYVVLEVAAQALSLNRVAGLELAMGIFTNFSPEHAEFYSTQQEYLEAKLSLAQLVQSGAPVIINHDDSAWEYIRKQYSATHKLYTFGLIKQSTHKAHVTAQITRDTLAGLELLLRTQVSTEKYVIKVPALVGAFNGYNILGAITSAQALGVNIQEIQKALESFTGVPGRLERYILANGATAFIDYAHNPTSYRAVLPMLRSLSKHMIVVFGAGGDRDKTMRPVMGALAAEYADVLVLTSDNPRSEDPADIIENIKQGIASEYYYKLYTELDREQAIYTAYKLSRAESMLVLLGKGPEEYQLIGDKRYFFSEACLLKDLQN